MTMARQVFCKVDRGTGTGTGMKQLTWVGQAIERIKIDINISGKAPLDLACGVKNFGT